MFSQYLDFKKRLNDAVEQMKLVLDKNKSLTLIGEQDHQYIDKYSVSEAVTNSTTWAFKAALESLGLSKDLKIDHSRNVILRFSYSESCKFNRKEKKVIPTVEITSQSTTHGTSETTVGTVVQEFFWDLAVSYQVYLVYGGEAEPFGYVVPKQSQVFEMKTTVDQRPRNDSSSVLDVDITPIVNLSPFTKNCFSINRADTKCFTPRRNKDTEKFYQCIANLLNWAQQIFNHLTTHVLSLAHVDPGSYLAIQLFSPVVPVLEKLEEMESNKLIYIVSHEKTLQSISTHCTNLFHDTKYVPFAVLGLHVRHIEQLSQSFLDSVQYIENLIQEQLVAAIGKSITGKDLAEYMTFHNRNLFKSQFNPKSFSVDVRRQGYTPEGNVAIECTDKTIITTISKLYKDPPPVKIALTASTQVMLEGSHHIHGFISYQFSTEPAPSYQISARARQFSSFILLIGTVVENDLFDAKHGIIIKNKDDLLIPLLFETIPTAKEFKDAIASLSPEQQRFAKAYRKMQLESTIFSVCLVQIKPQLENVLNLPPGSLTKEIKLTQALMQLFIEHQIPSDLLKYEGEGTKPLVDKIDYIKQAAEVLLDMIDEAKDKELDEKKQLYEIAQEVHPPPMRSAPVFAFGGPVPAGPPPTTSLFGGSPMPSKSQGFGSSLFGSSQPAPPVAAAPSPFGAPAFSPAIPTSGAVFGATQSNPVVQAVGMVRNAANSFVFGQSAANAPAETAPQQTVPQENWEDIYDTDYKSIPTKLDKAYEKLSPESSIRPTIIKVNNLIKRTRKEGFYSPQTTESLFADGMKTERSQALDLMDALTRSGELPLVDCEMHVVIAMTQCFDKSLMETIVQDNCNPIEVIERSVLVMAKEVLGESIPNLVKESEMSRLSDFS
ncbi:hypothetical protein HDV04_005324 [Boothiomyces sp. JEL0838]|nr:hypothetical protein HDV04_005324 [Boothiomyces sp. JEL0838]